MGYGVSTAPPPVPLRLNTLVNETLKAKVQQSHGIAHSPTLALEVASQLERLSSEIEGLDESDSPLYHIVRDEAAAYAIGHAANCRVFNVLNGSDSDNVKLSQKDVDALNNYRLKLRHLIQKCLEQKKLVDEGASRNDEECVEAKRHIESTSVRIPERLDYEKCWAFGIDVILGEADAGDLSRAIEKSKEAAPSYWDHFPAKSDRILHWALEQ